MTMASFGGRRFWLVMLVGLGWWGMVWGGRGEAFPSLGLMPKAETGALRFLERHPEYDGRGVVVAVFDTGVDPGAPGLQQTPDGRPKILDVVDGTGDGDVVLGEDVEAVDGVLQGVSGRELRVFQGWVNPTGRYRLGLKRVEDFFPRELVSRLQSKRREAWDREQLVLERQLELAVAELRDAKGEPGDEEWRKKKEEVEVRLAEFRKLREGDEDFGPVFDCVAFHDGEVWRAVVDTDEDGDLAEEMVLTDFRRERRHGTFGGEALLHFAVNFYENGKVLSLVVDSGMHGTHVAGIVAAHFPGQPELDGVAPGAQIVSVKIGDARLDSMETSTGFERGLAVVRQWKCDVINLSYGEPTTSPNRGRLIEQLTEVVHEDGVVFVAAAGNNGPALTTVGAPGGTTSALIGVGAAVSPEMMRSGYSMRGERVETQFTFSSRGPTEDGDMGVNVSAPGGAISPVPNWTLRRGQLANGTSMASPNAAGGVALILSGLKAEKVAWTPDLVRRALENSAREMSGLSVFDQGRGMVQVDRAFALAKALAASGVGKVRWEVGLPRRGGARGVYLREREESEVPLETVVQVRPVLRRLATPADKVAVEQRFRLVSTADWVETPEALLMYHEARSFEIRVDPTRLPPGVHYAEIQATEVPEVGGGPAFRVPVTVVRPDRVEMGMEGGIWRGEVGLEAGRVARRFVAVPAGVTRAEFRLRAGAFDGTRRVVCHVKQLIPGRSDSATGRLRYVSLSGGAVVDWAMAVEGGRTMEVCLGKTWQGMEGGRVEMEVRFGGITPGSREVVLDAGALGRWVELSAGAGRVQVTPRANLMHRRRSVVPSETALRPLDPERDGGSDGVVFRELVLTYRFEMEAAGSVVPRFPALNGRLYEGEFGSQLYTVLDGEGRRVGWDDGWEPGPMALEEGRHELRLHLRHDRAERLEGMRTLPLVLEEDLESAVDLSFYATPEAALTSGNRWTGRTLEPGQRVAVWLAGPSTSAWKGKGKAGEVWTGTIRYQSGDGVTEYPLVFVLGSVEEEKGGDVERGKKSKAGLTDKDDGPGEEALARWSQSLEDSDPEVFESVARDLMNQHPEHRPWRRERLEFLEEHRDRLGVSRVVAGLEDLVKRVDEEAVAAGLGRRKMEGDEAIAESRRAAEADRDLLVEAMALKVQVLAGKAFPWDGSEEDGEDGEEDGEVEVVSGDRAGVDAETAREGIAAAYAVLERWVDLTEEEYLDLHLYREAQAGRWGQVLRRVREQLDESPGDEQWQERKVRVLEALGWEAWAQREEARQRYRDLPVDERF